jgi:hypothetical protein
MTALGLTDIVITKLLDGRRGKNTRHKLSGRGVPEIAPWQPRCLRPRLPRVKWPINVMVLKKAQ